jgi:hypothetical protein
MSKQRPPLKKGGRNIENELFSKGFAEITGENIDKIRVYTITREVDSSTPLLEKQFRYLKREFGYDLETDECDVDNL